MTTVRSVGDFLFDVDAARTTKAVLRRAPVASSSSSALDPPAAALEIEVRGHRGRQHPASFNANPDDLSVEGGDGEDDEPADPNAYKPPFNVYAPYPVGDWYLEDRDGGACMGYKNDYKKGSGGFSAGAPSVAGLMGYGGELQLLEDYRTPSLLFSDLTNTMLFTCPSGRPTPHAPYMWHPQLEFRQPHHKVHVHLEDKAAGAAPKVLWDAEYDMGGTEYLKSTLIPIAGKKQTFEPICPPGVRMTKPHMMQDFIGEQVITAYRPDHDPELAVFRPIPGTGVGGACAVM